MRVLFFQHAWEIGGSVVSLGITASYLRRCHDVEPTICLARSSEQVRRYYEERLELATVYAGDLALINYSTVAPEYVWDPRTWLRLFGAAGRMRDTIRQAIRIATVVSADLVHINSLPLVSVGVAMQRHGVPVVQHVREPPRNRLAVRRALLQWASSAADARIFLTDFDRSRWGPKPRDIIVPNFVDTGSFRPPSRAERHEARSQLGLAEDEFVLLYVGGASEAKGVRLVVQLLDRLRFGPVASPPLTVLMPGSRGPRRESGAADGYRRIRRWAGRPTAADRLRRGAREQPSSCLRALLLPPMTDMLPVYWASDLLIAPSSRPHFSRPALEAAAAGLPAIGSDLPGLRELIVDSETGVLVDSPDVGPWEVAVREMASNDGLRRLMGEAARQKAVRDFDANRPVKRIAELYQRLLS